MAQFSIAIADEDVDRVMDAIAANYGWSSTVANPNYNSSLETSESNPETIDNPENKYVFTNKVVRQFLSDNVASYEVRVAKESAANSVDINVNISDPQLP